MGLIQNPNFISLKLEFIVNIDLRSGISVVASVVGVVDVLVVSKLNVADVILAMSSPIPNHSFVVKSIILFDIFVGSIYTGSGVVVLI